MNIFIYGTGNTGKIQYMQEVFRPLALRLVGIGEYLPSLPEVDESGNNPGKNARIKALNIYRRFVRLRESTVLSFHVIWGCTLKAFRRRSSREYISGAWAIKSSLKKKW